MVGRGFLHIGLMTFVILNHMCTSNHVLATKSSASDPVFHPAHANVSYPYVSSHRLSDGTRVDCVKREDQPALQHPDPIIKAQKLRKFSSNMAIYNKKQAQYLKETGGVPPEGCGQLFHREVGSCPTGTVPILRQNIARGRHMADHLEDSFANIEATPEYKPTADHHFVQVSMYSGRDGAYWGASAHISTWDMHDATTYDTDFTTSQIWVSARRGNKVDTVQAGVHIYPHLYEDHIDEHGNPVDKYLPRLFTYFSTPKYIDRGCYNFLCWKQQWREEGNPRTRGWYHREIFVQMGDKHLIGGTVDNATNPKGHGHGHVFKFTIEKQVNEEDVEEGLETGDWWLEIDNSYIGYFDQEFFTQGQLKAGLANLLSWGGSVFRSQSENSIVKMGNGKYGKEAEEQDTFPEVGDLDTPAYHKFLRYSMPIDDDISSLESLTAEDPDPVETTPSLYNLTMKENNGEHWIFFGGPGS